MLGSIINSCIGMTRNCHHHFVYRVDSLPTVRHIKDNGGKVFIGVGKLLSRQAHSSCSYKCSYRSIPTTKTIVIIQTIETIVSRGFITTHHMLCTIIFCRIGMTRNGHYHLCYRINRQPTVRHVKNDRSKVVVGVSKLLSRQAHSNCSYKCSYRSITTTKSIVILRIEWIADNYFIADHSMLSSVIYNSIRMTGNSHRYFCYRINGLPAVSYVKNDCCKVFVGVSKLISNQTHVGSTYYSSYSSIATTESKVILSIKRIANGHLITNHTMLSAIINCAVGMTSNSHRHFSYRINGLPTIGHIKDYGSKVVIDIGKLISN